MLILIPHQLQPKFAAALVFDPTNCLRSTALISSPVSQLRISSISSWATGGVHVCEEIPYRWQISCRLKCSKINETFNHLRGFRISANYGYDCQQTEVEVTIKLLKLSKSPIDTSKEELIQLIFGPIWYMNRCKNKSDWTSKMSIRSQWWHAT